MTRLVATRGGRSCRVAVGVAVVAVLLAAGCTGDRPESPTIQTGDYYRDWWPLRGSLAGHADARDELAAVVSDWRTPEGVGTHAEATALVWLGEVDGVVLGLVDFHEADNRNKSWLLEVTGRLGSLAVTNALSYSRFLLNENVLPVRSPEVGPRYLVSTRVGALAGPDARIAIGGEGLTERLDLPRCRATGITASLHGAGFDYRGVDLGPGIAAPFYPLLEDGFLGDPAAPVLAGLDTCAAASAGGWLGSGDSGDHPAGTVGGYSHLLKLGVAGPVGVEPGDLPGTWSRVLAEYVDTSGSVRRADWLLWTYPTVGDGRVTDVGPPFAGVETLAEEPGLLVTRMPEQPFEIDYTTGGGDRRATITPP